MDEFKLKKRAVLLNGSGDALIYCLSALTLIELIIHWKTFVQSQSSDLHCLSVGERFSKYH